MFAPGGGGNEKELELLIPGREGGGRANEDEDVLLMEGRFIDILDIEFCRLFIDERG